MYEINWQEGCEELHKSLCTLVKYNKGNWKSEKQGRFFLSKALPRTKEDLKEYFGIIIHSKEANVVETSGYMHIAHGSRGTVPYTKFFLINEKGVQAVYRLRYKGNLRDGCAPNAEKTELKWSRNTSTNKKGVKRL